MYSFIRTQVIFSAVLLCFGCSFSRHDSVEPVSYSSPYSQVQCSEDYLQKKAKAKAISLHTLSEVYGRQANSSDVAVWVQVETHYSQLLSLFEDLADAPPCWEGLNQENFSLICQMFKQNLAPYVFLSQQQLKLAQELKKIQSMGIFLDHFTLSNSDPSTFKVDSTLPIRKVYEQFGSVLKALEVIKNNVKDWHQAHDSDEFYHDDDVHTRYLNYWLKLLKSSSLSSTFKSFLERRGGDSSHEQANLVFEKYKKVEKRYGAIDFKDLLTFLAALKEPQERFNAILAELNTIGWNFNFPNYTVADEDLNQESDDQRYLTNSPAKMYEVLNQKIATPQSQSTRAQSTREVLWKLVEKRFELEDLVKQTKKSGTVGERLGARISNYIDMIEFLIIGVMGSMGGFDSPVVIEKSMAREFSKNYDIFMKYFEWENKILTHVSRYLENAHENKFFIQEFNALNLEFKEKFKPEALSNASFEEVYDLLFFYFRQLDFLKSKSLSSDTAFELEHYNQVSGYLQQLVEKITQGGDWGSVVPHDLWVTSTTHPSVAIKDPSFKEYVDLVFLNKIKTEFTLIFGNELFKDLDVMDVNDFYHQFFERLKVSERTVGEVCGDLKMVLDSLDRFFIHSSAYDGSIFRQHLERMKDLMNFMNSRLGGTKHFMRSFSLKGQMQKYQELDAKFLNERRLLKDSLMIEDIQTLIEQDRQGLEQIGIIVFNRSAGGLRAFEIQQNAAFDPAKSYQEVFFILMKFNDLLQTIASDTRFNSVVEDLKAYCDSMKHFLDAIDAKPPGLIESAD